MFQCGKYLTSFKVQFVVYNMFNLSGKFNMFNLLQKTQAVWQLYKNNDPAQL